MLLIMKLHIIILAAGQGTRMRSTRPKVLHLLAGKPLLTHVIETAMSLNPDGIHVVIGHNALQIQENLAHLPVRWVQQERQLGTGHAVLQALPGIEDTACVLILSGDVPLIQAKTLQSLLQQHNHTLDLLLAVTPNPTGLGRIIRKADGSPGAIIEEKDATEQVLKIQEIYSGICCTSAQNLNRWLPALSNDNQQKEYYLTSIVAMAVAESVPITSIQVEDLSEIQGINQRSELHKLERAVQQRTANKLLQSGVSLADALRIDIRGTLNCAQDVWIDINNVFIGENNIGQNSSIGANCHLTNVTIGNNCIILPNSVLEGCLIGDHCHIGPFARIRSGTILDTGCKIGNFVETKKAVFGASSKANHLSYLGDVTVGSHVNLGAGTITCNYDGMNKHHTTIHDHVFIGSGTQLVAPVTVGAHATIGAGSTLRKSAPAGELTLTAGTQKTILGWTRKKKSSETI